MNRADADLIDENEEAYDAYMEDLYKEKIRRKAESEGMTVEEYREVLAEESGMKYCFLCKDWTVPYEDDGNSCSECNEPYGP